MKDRDHSQPHNKFKVILRLPENTNNTNKKRAQVTPHQWLALVASSCWSSLLMFGKQSEANTGEIQAAGLLPSGPEAPVEHE